MAAEAAVKAGAQTLWSLITDITVMPRFSTELQQVSWAEGYDGPSLGAQFIGVNRHPAVGEWQTLSTIVDFDRPRVFAWAVGDPDCPAATWRFDIAPHDGGCALRYTARIGPGPSGVTMLIEREPDRAGEIISGRLAQLSSAMAATLEGIAALARERG